MATADQGETRWYLHPRHAGTLPLVIFMYLPGVILAQLRLVARCHCPEVHHVAAIPGDPIVLHCRVHVLDCDGSAV